MATRRTPRKADPRPALRKARGSPRAPTRGKGPSRVHVPVVVEQDEDGVFIMSVPTLQGCRSYGYTLEEAMANVSEAALLCLEDEKPASNGTRFVGLRDLEIVR
ncbi:MAG: type II toxin-antitoxin system HicB family antitoxin [Phycisphaerales bacterium]